MDGGNEANFAKVGLFILAGVLLIAGTLVYIGTSRGEKNEFLVETYFKNDVSGLDVGSAVNFRGVRIGAVKEISFVGSEYENVPPHQARNIYVLLALDSRRCRIGKRNEDPMAAMRRMLDNGLHSTVSASGITGLSRIELNFPKTAVLDEKVSWEARHMVIPPAPSIFESAADSATRVMQQLDKMDFVGAWSNIVRLTGSAAGLCEDLGEIVETERGRIGTIIESMDGAASSLRTFSDEIRDNPSLLLRSRDAEPLDETR